jgi:hypothetical protein
MTKSFFNKFRKLQNPRNSSFYKHFSDIFSFRFLKNHAFFFNKRPFLSLIVAKEVFTFVLYSNTLLNHQKMLKKTSQARFNGKLQNLLFTLLLMAGLAFPLSSAYGQGWERHYGTIGDDLGQAVIQTKDLGFLGVGFSNRVAVEKNFDVYAVKTDVDGKELWSRFYNEGLTDHGYDVLATVDNGYLIVGDTRMNDQANSNVLLVRIDDDGRKIWSKQFGASDDETGYRIIPTTKSGGYLIVGTSTNTTTSNSDIFILKIDANGNEVWSKTLGTNGKDAGRAVIEVADGYLVAGSAFNAQNNSIDFYLLKIDFAGNKNWDKFFGENEIDEGHSILATNDGNFAIAGSTGAISDIQLIKVNGSGGLIWNKTFGGALGDAGFEMIKASNGDLLIAGITEISSSNTDAYVLRVDSNGNRVWSTTIGRSSHIDWAQGLAFTHNNGFIVIGNNAQFGTLINDLTLIKLSSEGTVSTNRVRGRVFADNNDCIYTADEKGLSGWMIRAASATKTYYATTNSEGYYDLELDKGVYSVSLIVKSPYWNACIAAYNVNFTNTYDTLVRNFPVLQAVQCPLIEIDVSAPMVQTCAKVTYTVNYCNIGVTKAISPSIHIILDNKLSLTGASIPWSFNKDSLYIFEVKELDQQQCDLFTFTAIADCKAITGQAYMVSARVLPDSSCITPSTQWDRSSIQVNGYCDGDSVRFKVENKGVGDMKKPVNFIVIEDHIMFNSPAPIQLRANENKSINIKATGATYRLSSEQSVGHPGKSIPTIAVEGCTTGNSISTGFVTEFHEDEANVFLSKDVQESITNSDYILFRGYPKGYFRDGKFLIPANTDLEYHVFFRNTTADTIRQLVIRDTLPAALNIGTLTAGSSSHPYHHEVYGSGVLKITFENIQLLPDGSTNSFGFVKFKLSQKPDNPAGTEIPNSAAVFFANKAPVNTTKLVHVVGKGNSAVDFMQIITDAIGPEVAGVKVEVRPNPVSASAEFEVKESSFNRLELDVFDLNGRMVRNEQSTGNVLRFWRNDIPTGMYAYRFTGDGKLLGTGKLIIR